MKKIDVSLITDAARMPIKASVLDFIQTAPTEIVANAIIGMIGDTYSSTQVYILWGVDYDAGSGTVSDGAVFYNGEVYKFNSQSATPPYVFFIQDNVIETITFSDGSHKDALIEKTVYVDVTAPYNIGTGLKIPNLFDLDTTTVKLTGNQTIAGTKTFSSFSVTPSSAPTTNYQTANKKYADDVASTAQTNAEAYTDLKIKGGTFQFNSIDSGNVVESSLITLIDANLYSIVVSLKSTSFDFNGLVWVAKISYAGSDGFKITVIPRSGVEANKSITLSWVAVKI